MDDKQVVWLKRFFWAAYVVFLAASIPHIATWFHHFDTSANAIEDGFWWVVSYAIALTIDVTDVLLTVAIVKKMERGERGFFSYLLLWSFVFAIMALSVFINWQYNIQYATTEFVRADGQTVLGVSVGTINPLIGSAFQLFVLAYTAIAHTVLKKTETKTYEQLQAELAEKQNMRALQKQFDAMKAEERDEKIGGLFNTLRGVKQRGKELLSEQQTDVETDGKTVAKPEVNTGPLPAQNGSQNGPEFASETEVKPVVNDEQNDGFTGPKSDEIITLNEDQMEVLTRYPGMASILSTGRPTASLTEISAATEIGEKLLLNRVRNKELKHTARNEKLVYVDSVFSFLKTFKPAAKKASETGKIIELKTARKDGEYEEDFALENDRQSALS